ncbi:uncharacterized protein RCC_04023 [Ramularia collo-cygni]|uniref:Beta-glucuronidase C-terminal domain-containing protein n=1 Tax=Ramularia collo-cygni TaxID=112498 RepID=A0A2D3VCF0_9PEZI|nr:uncharacterized protein RCC_04023 [Ramularia collo-cygni]CZT18183.1 uncharacterized protein RCC_04023 [Ramularia collo-cygni]
MAVFKCVGLLASGLLCAAAPQPQIAVRHESTISVADEAPSTAAVPLNHFMSYSIEFSSFPDFAGNISHPNTFSDNLLNNLASFAGTKPIIRVGGNTQDFAVFNATQTEAFIGSFNPILSEDYPTTISFGPAYFESYNTWPDVQFVHGFNLGGNSTSERQALIESVPYACKALSTGNLLHWELGNEPDLFNSTNAAFAKRPATWGNEEYVDEWRNWTSAIDCALREACPELPISYYAPSFAGYSNGLDGVKVWELGINSDKDIAFMSSHNYVSGAPVPGVTLQGTLMNHTSSVVSINKQLDIARQLANLPEEMNADLPFILGEHNSLYRQGRPGLSNTFGATLWGVDFNLYCAASNIRRVHMHMGTNYRYQSWQPISTDKDSIGTKAPYYGNVAVAAFIGDVEAAPPSIVNIPLADEKEAAYASYVDGKLAKIIVINMMAYNATDYNKEFITGFPRPVVDYSFQLGSALAGKTASLQRLNANGSDAISGVTFDGYSYNFELDEGKPVLLQNVTRGEQVCADGNGLVSVSVPWSSAVILELD